MFPISSSLIFVNNNSFKMVFPCSFSKKSGPIKFIWNISIICSAANMQNTIAICLWTKIRTKQWLVLGAGSLCLKFNNFACLHTQQGQNELHLKRWFFFVPKLTSPVRRSQPFPSVVQACTQPYSFGGRIKVIIWQIRHESECYHSRNKH